MINKTLLFTATTKSINRIILVLALLLASVNVALAQGLNPAISIQPGTRVEVGEEVYFSATGTTYTANPALLAKADFRWDFGDGYACQKGSGIPGQPYYYVDCKSIAITHYFMTPGDYTVTLSVDVWNQWTAGTAIGIPPVVATGTATTVVHVTGTAPIANFEIQHAPFNNRTKQYLYIEIPPAYRAGTTQLKVSLIGNVSGTTVLLLKSNLASEEKLLLDHTVLSLDNYVLQAQLLDSGNNQITGGIWRDKFTKSVTTPAVSIDENNSFLLNGTLFFPIGPYMDNVGDYSGQLISVAHINMLDTEGWYETHTPATWKDYLNKANAAGLVAIGPGRGDYYINFAPAGANYWVSNHNVDEMATYISTNKGSPAMFAWKWQDEPNGPNGSTPYAATLGAWGYVGHRDDPHHPSFNLMYGYDWSPYYGTSPTIWDYLGSAWFFGGKKWVQDVFAFDVYPISHRLHPTLNFVGMGPYAAYLAIFDQITTFNKGLVPVLPTLQPCAEITGSSVGFTPTDAQVYLETWMNVIHGAKGIVWFPLFDMANSGRWTAMKKFTDQMAILAPVVLGPVPARTVTDNANTALNRVDTMIREKDGVVYVFAARVTEPDPITGSNYQGAEPDSITVNFTMSGFTGSTTAVVVDEGRTISLTNGKFTDTFVKNAVHIYKIVTLRPPSPRNLRVH